VDTVRTDPAIRHDAVLEAVAFAAERLLLAADWREAADEVLARMGVAAGVSRAYVIENHRADDGRLLGTMRHEWCAPGVASQAGTPFLDAAPWDEGLDRWAAMHARGEAIVSHVADLPAAERGEFEALGIVSIAEHPVFVDGAWWGAIGFDDCASERAWKAELEALRAAATLLGAAVTRHRVERDRLRAERRWRQVIEHIPAVTYTDVVVDDGVRMEFVSPQIRSVLGYEPDGFLADDGLWFSLIHPDDMARLEASGVLSAEDTSVFDEVYRMRAADGTYRWIHDTSTPVFREDGALDHFLGFMLDVTERMDAQERLRLAEQRYRALIEHIPAVVYRESPDADPAKFYISPQVHDLFGYTPDEWTWHDNFWLDGIHPDDRAEVQRVDGASNATKAPYAAEYRFRHADGQWVWIHDEATFVPEPDGEGFWQGFLVDITERRRAEDRLRDAELKFRTIVEQNQAIFYTQEIDPDDPAVSLTTYIAPGNTDLIGYTLEDIQADPSLWRSIIHPDDRDRVLSADAESNAGGGGDRFSLEYRMIGKDGRIVWVQDEARLVRLEGKAPYWQGFLLDVTERKEAETQLERALSVEREATQRLRSLDELKNTFLQAVSHDLRTPLAAILGLAITLERGDVRLDEDDARDLARRIAGNARRLERLVTNLLDMDRLARGIVTPTLERADVGELVGRVAVESELVPPARLVLELERVVQPVDAAKVERIVENLVANAVRHAPGDATIWVRVEPDPDGVLIAVEDDGPGVPAELRDRIFEPFRQGPGAPQHSPGVGVGLTLVRRFAQLLGGRAWVQEREGGGASFRVVLPAEAPAGAPVLPPPDPARPTGALGLLPPADLPVTGPART
jgi:PAS domain S-box-containing protein